MGVVTGGGGGGTAFNGGTITNSLDIASGAASVGPLLEIDASNLVSQPTPLQVDGSDGVTTGTILRNQAPGGLTVTSLAANIKGLRVEVPANASVSWLEVVDGNGGSFSIDQNGRLSLELRPTSTAAEAVRVFDKDGNPIFQVNADGSLQGKTGQALTFNL